MLSPHTHHGIPPVYSWYRPSELMISPAVLNTPSVLNDIPQCTARALCRVVLHNFGICLFDIISIAWNLGLFLIISKVPTVASFQCNVRERSESQQWSNYCSYVWHADGIVCPASNAEPYSVKVYCRVYDVVFSHLINLSNLHCNLGQNYSPNNNVGPNKKCLLVVSKIFVIFFQEFELDVLQEAYTTEHWLVRIYKVKDLDNRGA